MKKIYGILMVLVIAFFTPFMVACNETTPDVQVTLVEINDRELHLEVGDSYQLRYSVLPDEVAAEKKGVRFESNNSAISVTNTGMVTAISPTTTPAIIKIYSVSNPNAYNVSTCTVTVVAQKASLPTPTGLYFDVLTNELKWNKLNYPNFEERYGLTLTPENGTPEYFELTDNVFSDYRTGVHYTAKVKYLGGASTTHNDSEYSKTVTFEKLSTPELALTPSETVNGEGDTTVDARDWKISFDTVAHAPILDSGNRLANYDISLTYSNVSIDVAAGDLEKWNNAVQNAEIIGNSTTGWTVTITIPEDMSNNEYRVTVKALGNINNKGDICDSAIAYVDFDKLATPDNMIITGDNVLTWNNVQNAQSYKIVYRYKSNFGGTGEFEELSTIIPAGSNVYHIPAEIMQNKSSIYVYMYAMGNNANVIDSPISPYCARTKLAKVTDLTLADRTSSDDLEFRWTAVSDAGTYRITVARNGVTLYTYSQQAVQGVNTHTIALDAIDNNQQALLVNGDYTVAVTSVPTSTVSHVESDPSETITVTKLSLPNIRVSEGKLIWNESNIPDETIKYDLAIQNSERDWGVIKLGYDVLEYSLTGGDYAGFDGEFDIALTTRGGENKYIIDSNTDNIKVTKMPIPGVLKIQDGEIQTVDSTYCYRMIVEQQLGGKFEECDTQNFDSDGMDTVRTYLHDLDAGFAYRLSLVNTGLKNAGPNDHYIYSEVSDGLVVRFLTNPSIGLVDGVLTITKPNDPYIFDGNKLKEGFSLNYEIKVGSQSITTQVPALDSDSKVLNKVSFTLPDLAGTTTIYARAVVTYTGQDQNFEILNSEYVASGRVTVLGRVTGIKLESNVLSWNPVDNASGYRITVTKNKSEVVSDVLPSDVYTNSVAIDSAKFGDTGNYSISIIAIGNRTSYINSYSSAPCNITRLAAPTPTVQDGKLVWSSVTDSNGSVVQNYTLYYRNRTTQVTGSAKIQGFETTFSTLPAGEYDNIYVIALSEGLMNTLDTSTAEAQNKGSGLVVTKLAEVDTDSIDVTDSSISWSNPSTLNYSIALSRIESNGSRTTLKTDNVVESSDRFNYVMPTNYGGGEFRINITTLGGDNQINSSPVELVVFLLDAVTGTNIAPDASDNNISKLYSNALTQSSLPGYSSITQTGNLIELTDINYEVKYQSTTSQNNDIITKNFLSENLNSGVALTSVYQTTNEQGDDYLAPGSLVNVTIRTRVSDDKRIQDCNGTKYYILDSPYSTLYQFKLLSAPSITINDSGILAWGGDSANISVNISFYECNGSSVATQATFTKTFGKDVYNYDLADSELIAGKDYIVKTQAVGNGRDKQSSDLIESDMIIHKLPTLIAGEDWYVQDGQIVWNTVNGANEYVLYYTPAGGKTNNYTAPQTDLVTYTYLPKVNAGDLSIQFQVKGKVTGETVTINSKNYTRGYINSVLSESTTVTKLGKATLQVINGELSWGNIRNNSGYEITINNDKVDYAGNSDEMQQFILSEHYNNALDTNYTVKLYARGNSVTDFNNRAFLNGEYSNSKSVLLYAPTNINVLDGKLVWDSLESHHNLNYEMQLISNSGQEIKTFNKQKTTNLSEYVGKTFNSIAIRFKGGNSAPTDTATVALNSKYSDKLLNVHKFANIASDTTFATINTQGNVVWNYTDATYATAKPKTNITSYLSVENHKSDTFVTQLDYNSTMTFDLSTSVSDLEIYASSSYTPQVVMDIYAMGTSDSASATGTLYLNSEIATFETYKFNPIQDFFTDNVSSGNGGTVNLNLTWNAITTAVVTPEKTIYPDQFIMRYKKVTDQEWSTKMFTSDNIQELGHTPQFFTAGNYQFELYAFASTQDMLPSDIAYANNGAENIPFLAFQEGNGSSDSPFTISTKTQLHYINYLKSSFFELTNSIDMGTEAVGEYGRNLTMIDKNIGRDSEFTGGLDGNGFRLYNIEYNMATYLALFQTVRGAKTQNTDNQFYGKSGVILNLTLEIAKLSCLLVSTENTNITQKALNNNYGLLVQNNYGYIYNCHIKSSENSTMNILMMDNVALAGIAGTNASNSDNSGGVIEHCTNSINFNATQSATITIDSVDYAFNTNSKVAGIVAYNMGGTVLACNNYANISAGTAGGIAYYNNYVRYIQGEIDLAGTPGDDDIQINSNINGCVNYGKLAIKNYVKYNSDVAEWLPVGGIAAINSYGTISYCLNTAEIKLIRISNEYTWTVMLGGIVGIIDYGNVYNSYSYDTIIVNPFDENLYDEANSTYGKLNDNVVLVTADIACYVSINQFEVTNIAYHKQVLSSYNSTTGTPTYINPDGALPITSATSTELILQTLNAESNIDAPIMDYLGNAVAWYAMDNTVSVAYGYAHITRVTGGSIIIGTTVAGTNGKDYGVTVLPDTGYELSNIVYQIGTTTAEEHIITITDNSGTITLSDVAHIIVKPTFAPIEYTITNASQDVLQIYVNNELATSNICNYDDLITINIIEGKSVSNVYYTYEQDGQTVRVDVPLSSNTRCFRMPTQNITLYAE